MRLPINPATTLMRDLRTQLRAQSPAGRVIVAIDGLDAGATAAFADLFADVLAERDTSIFRASMSGFLLPREERPAGGLTPASYDLRTLRRVLVEPFRDRGHTSATTSFQLSAWDAVRDQAEESRWASAGPDAVLVLDGPFVNQEALRDSWNWSAWLSVSDAVLAQRPGRSSEKPYTDTEFAYLRTSPQQTASVIVDNTDPARPVQSYNDFC